MASVTTQLANLINPEVIAASLEVKLVNLIKFSPLATVGRTLVGQPGDTLSIPVFEYIGDAVDTAEGVAIDTSMLTASTSTVTVKKAAKGVEISDEAVLSAYGDPIGESERQLGISLAQKVDNDCLASFATIGAGMTVDISGAAGAAAYLAKETIADAVVKFGEDLDTQIIILIAPSQYAAIRKDPNFVYVDFGASIISGQVGKLHGVDVVISNKIVKDAGTGKIANFIVKAGALGIEMKRDVAVETFRKVSTKTTLITADIHYVTYLRDASKAVKVICKG